jgi:pilus assembly protein CpaC
MREVVTKFPGLGDIPGIGVLFRSQSFQKGETELLILVTPHLAKPVLPGDVRLPTDGIAEAGDFGFYLGGKLEGRAPQNYAVSGSGHAVE